LVIRKASGAIRAWVFIDFPRNVNVCGATPPTDTNAWARSVSEHSLIDVRLANCCDGSLVFLRDNRITESVGPIARCVRIVQIASLIFAVREIS